MNRKERRQYAKKKVSYTGITYNKLSIKDMQKVESTPLKDITYSVVRDYFFSSNIPDAINAEEVYGNPNSPLYNPVYLIHLHNIAFENYLQKKIKDCE